ncbi:SPOR domain-containing protein [Gilliamella sp. App2-1]|uniref:SPOR domain-containing protein n=2 Tax=unclassified Gilliamella TaxID=2685620 RepID=UPI0011464664|nr:SPOR domain-containing protein [Gilliamella apicola]
MIFLAIIIIILFSAILYFIANNAPQKNIEPRKAKTQTPVITLPEQPQERWTYLKELETPNANYGSISSSTAGERQQILDSFIKNARTVAPSLQENTAIQNQSSNVTPTITTKWLLQCGAFKDKSNADTLKAKLAMTGIRGNISSGQLYRVTVGPYTSKQEANKVLNSLNSNGFNNCIISN